MKRIFSILVLATLMSCTSEEQPTECGCGVVDDFFQPSPFIHSFLYYFNDECTGVRQEQYSIEYIPIGTRICLE